MKMRHRTVFGRRGFLGSAAGALAGLVIGRTSCGDDRPVVVAPRATSGDDVGPKWDESIAVTVGPKKADLVGDNERVIQAAVDYIARFGGGTVHLLPGTYRLRNAIYLQSRVRVLGSGAESVLVKEPSRSTKIAANSDWYDQEITMTDAADFRVGDGVAIRSKSPFHDERLVLKRTLVARSGNRFKVDRPLREDIWLKGEPTAASLFPILSGENISDVVIENITLDGNKEKNENFDGNYAGCIFLQDSNRFTIRGVTARNFNGDGISFQICHDVLVENCHSHDNAGLGFHPGSGSQRPVIRNNRSERNDIGIFFCWGVKFGLAESNTLTDNRSYGVSIGHCDTDNIVRDNEILRSGKVGVLFRQEPRAFAAHRNRIERNRIVDSGPETGVGVDVQGETESITIARNEIRETRQPMQRIGVRIGEKTADVQLNENRIEGYAVTVADMRKAE